MTSFTDRFNALTKKPFYQLMDDALFRPQTGGEYPLKVDFNDEEIKDDFGNVIDVSRATAEFFTDDAPTLARNDTLAINSTDYLVIDVFAGADGMTQITLRKPR